MANPIFEKAAGIVLPKVRPVVFQLKKHLPEILVGTGAVSIAGGTVLACRATLKAKDIMDEPVEACYRVEGPDGESMTIEDVEAGKRIAVKRGFEIVGCYVPSVALVGGGIAMLVAAKSIEHRRFTAMLGAYSSLQAMFEEYRGRVVAEGGPEMDYRCLHGVETVEVEVLEDKGDGKKPKKAKEEVVVFTAGEDPFHRVFDECNSDMWKENLNANEFFLECQERVLNQRLKAEGRIFLSEVYEALGFEYNPVGQFVGWLADDVEGSKDGYISFGVDHAALKREVSRAQEAGERPEPSIWLTFNCDGEVWDKPIRKKYDI